MSSREINHFSNSNSSSLYGHFFLAGREILTWNTPPPIANPSPSGEKDLYEGEADVQPTGRKRVRDEGSQEEEAPLNKKRRALKPRVSQEKTKESRIWIGEKARAALDVLSGDKTLYANRKAFDKDAAASIEGKAMTVRSWREGKVETIPTAKAVKFNEKFGQIFDCSLKVPEQQKSNKFSKDPRVTIREGELTKLHNFIHCGELNNSILATLVGKGSSNVISRLMSNKKHRTILESVAKRINEIFCDTIFEKAPKRDDCESERGVQLMMDTHDRNALWQAIDDHKLDKEHLAFLIGDGVTPETVSGWLEGKIQIICGFHVRRIKQIFNQGIIYGEQSCISNPVPGFQWKWAPYNPQALRTEQQPSVVQSSPLDLTYQNAPVSSSPIETATFDDFLAEDDEDLFTALLRKE
jgi:hypothetical protein